MGNIWGQSKIIIFGVRVKLNFQTVKEIKHFMSERQQLADFYQSTVIFLTDSMTILELITVVQMRTYLTLFVRLDLSQYT